MNIHIKQDGQESGPFSKAELQDRVYSGVLSQTVLAQLELLKMAAQEFGMTT